MDGLMATIKAHKVLSAYFGIGVVYAYLQGNKANACAKTPAPGCFAWGGFGQSSSPPGRMTSYLENALFWPYAMLMGNKATNAQPPTAPIFLPSQAALAAAGAAPATH